MLKAIKTIILIIGVSLFAEGYSRGQTVIEGNWFLKHIHTPISIAPGTREEKIVIAIVDDGVRISHRDLESYIWKNPKEIPDNKIDDDGNGYVDDIHGWDVSDNDNTVTPPHTRLKEFYHGTHIAGIVTQIVQQAYGDSSSSFIKIMPVKSLADRAQITYLKDAYKGIEYAVRAGANIIICSWSVGFLSQVESEILLEAQKKGILIVASAGNFPEEIEQFPAAHNSALAVAALNQENKKIKNSNFGQFVDLSAPGIDIQSTSGLSDTAFETREGKLLLPCQWWLPQRPWSSYNTPLIPPNKLKPV
jgi:subtilisin family serine protease